MDWIRFVGQFLPTPHSSFVARFQKLRRGSITKLLVLVPSSVNFFIGWFHGVSTQNEEGQPRGHPSISVQSMVGEAPWKDSEDQKTQSEAKDLASEVVTNFQSQNPAEPTRSIGRGGNPYSLPIARIWRKSWKWRQMEGKVWTFMTEQEQQQKPLLQYKSKNFGGTIIFFLAVRNLWG